MPRSVMSFNPNAVFNIGGLRYKLSNYRPVKGDLVLDMNDGSYGVHDGEFAGRIAVKDGCVTEGVKAEFVKKLVLVG